MSRIILLYYSFTIQNYIAYLIFLKILTKEGLKIDTFHNIVNNIMKSFKEEKDSQR